MHENRNLIFSLTRLVKKCYIVLLMKNLLRIKSFFCLFLSLFIVFAFSGCQKKSDLKVNLNNKVQYKSEDGLVYDAKFYSLSDQSLYFVKLQAEGKEPLMLTRAISASGERYIDSTQKIEFWTKSDWAFVLESDGENARTVNLTQISAGK